MPWRSTRRWYLLPALPRSTGRGPGRLVAAFGSQAGAVEAGPRPVDGAEITQPVQQGAVHPGPDAQRLPLAQAPPAGHATAVPQLQRQVAPAQAMPQDEEDACQRRSIRDPRRAASHNVPQDVDDPGTRSGIGPPSGVRARQSAPARLWLLAPAPSLAASGELQVVHTLALHETIATAAAQQQARRLAWRQGTGCAVRDEPHHGPLGLLTHVTPGAEGVLRGQHPRRVAGHNSPVYDAGAVSPVRPRHYRPHPLPVPDGRARDRFPTWRRLGRQVGCGKHVSGSWRA
jgi:hypothetical protein